MKTLTLAAALALAASLSTAQAAQPAVEFTGTNSAFLDGNTRMIGWQFSVPAALQVTALGWFDWNLDGLARSHEIGIWESSTQTLVASLTVPAGTVAKLDGHFRWIDLATPVTLLPGTGYRIAGLDIGAGGDPHVWDNNIGLFNAQVNGLTVNAAVQLGSPGTALGGTALSFSFPGGPIGDARAALLGPNLAVTAVPEPGATLMLLCGWALLLALRCKARPAPSPGVRQPAVL